MNSSCQILISVERRLAVEYMMSCFFYSMAHYLYREHRGANIFCGQYLFNNKGLWVSLYPFTLKEIKCRTPNEKVLPLYFPNQMSFYYLLCSTFLMCRYHLRKITFSWTIFIRKDLQLLETEFQMKVAETACWDLAHIIEEGACRKKDSQTTYQ